MEIADVCDRFSENWQIVIVWHWWGDEADVQKSFSGLDFGLGKDQPEKRSERNKNFLGLEMLMFWKVINIITNIGEHHIDGV